MSVNRKFSEYVILVDPTTLQPYKAGTGGGGGGVSSSVNLLDDLGNPINAANALWVRGTVAVSSLPSVTVGTLPALPAGANAIGSVTVTSLPALPAGANAIGSVTVSSLPALPTGANVIGAVTQSGAWTVQQGGSPWGVTVSGTAAVTQSGTWTVQQGGSPWGVKTEVQVDYDTGAGTQNLSLVGLALPAAGGAVAGGTGTNPFAVVGAVAATQSGTWNVGLSAGSNVVGAVTQSGSWNVGLLAGSNVVGGVTQSGTWTVQQGGSPWGVKSEVQLDYDTGAGTQNLSLVGLALPASGGAVAGGTATNPLAVTGTVTVTGAVTVSGTVAATQSGTWNVGLSSGSNVVGAVTQSGTWNVGLLAGGNVIGAVTQSGTWTVAQGGSPWGVKSEVQLDYDTGAGTQNLSLVGLALPASGGAVAGGTGTNPFTVTGAVTVSGTVAATQSGAWSVTQSGTWNVGLSSGSNVVGAVTQSGTWTVQQGSPPWSVSQSGTWNVGLSAGSNVVGGVTQSGTWTVQQGTPPWSVSQSGTWNVTVSQLPAAAALADGTTNPTTTLFGAMPHVWNGATWDRLKDITAANGAPNASPGILGAGLVVFDTVGATYTRVNSAASGVAGGLDGKRVVSTGPMGYDGSAFYNLRLDASKNLNVNVNAALPAGGNVIGAVTQSGTWTVAQGAAAGAGGAWPIAASDGANVVNVGDNTNSAVRVNMVASSVTTATAKASGAPASNSEGQTVPLLVDLQGRLAIQQDDTRRILEQILVALTSGEVSPYAADRPRLFQAVRQGIDPPILADGCDGPQPLNRHGIPYAIGGHPNVQSFRANFTTAQTNGIVLTCPAGCRIVITRMMVTLDKGVTPNVSVIVGLAQSSTPTGLGVVGSHPNLDPGSGFVCGDGSGILTEGNDGDDLFITSSVPTGGSLDVVVSYFLIPS